MKNGSIDKFILSSYELLKNTGHSNRYYHTLTPKDNAPVVVHHITNQFTYIISGSGKAVLNGKEVSIKQGDSLFIEAKTTHQFIAGSEKLVLFHIHIPESGRNEDRYIIKGEDYERH